MDDVKGHKLYESLDWDDLESKVLRAPWIPDGSTVHSKRENVATANDLYGGNQVSIHINCVFISLLRLERTFGVAEQERTIFESDYIWDDRKGEYSSPNAYRATHRKVAGGNLLYFSKKEVTCCARLYRLRWFAADLSKLIFSLKSKRFITCHSI